MKQSKIIKPLGFLRNQLSTAGHLPAASVRILERKIQLAELKQAQEDIFWEAVATIKKSN